MVFRTGAKGANVSRLRQETGADITVSREDNTITIIGEYLVRFPVIVSS